MQRALSIVKGAAAAAIALTTATPWSDPAAERSGIVELQIPSPGVPEGFVLGPDGAFWFSERYTSQIGRVTSQGAFTIFTVPGTRNMTTDITAGPDGALWFTFPNNSPPMSSGKIGRITTSGQITLFTLPWVSDPESITTGPDGNLWFVDTVAAALGRITTSGVITKFAIPGPIGAYPYKIASGPDNALWFTDFNGKRIGRLSTAGELSFFPISPEAGYLDAITLGPDGNLWFTLDDTATIGRITTAGAIRLFEVPHPQNSYVFLNGIASAHGALWFTYFDYTSSASKVGRITTSGRVALVATPTQNGDPYAIAGGAPGTVWFTEAAARKVGRLTILQPAD